MEAGPRNTGRDGAGHDPESLLPAVLGLPAEPDGLSPDGPEHEQAVPEFEVELRPQRRLRIWQLAPIVMLAAAGR